jgi:hypothetical protein
LIVSVDILQSARPVGVREGLAVTTVAEEALSIACTKKTHTTSVPGITKVAIASDSLNLGSKRIQFLKIGQKV